MALRRRTANSGRRRRAIPPDAAPVARGLLVGVGARVDGAGEAQVGEFVEGLVAEERLADDVARCRWAPSAERQARWSRGSRAARSSVRVRRPRKQEKQEFHCSRRSAWTVKSSSFSGMLYSSFSMRRTVRLLRRRSVISWVRAVQIP